MNATEHLEAAEWLLNDARFLFAEYERLKTSDKWLADKIRINAEHSKALAEKHLNQAGQ